MIRLVLTAVWVCAIALGSTYVAASWKAGKGATRSPDDNLSGLNYEKTAAMNVPMVVDGTVQGYVVAQFVFTADAKTLKAMSVPPNPFIQDEAFRAIYADKDIDVRHLEKFDIATLTKGIVARVNARFQSDVVQDLLVEQFTYVSKDEIRAQAGEDAAGPVLSADTAAAAEAAGPGGETPPKPAAGGH